MRAPLARFELGTSRTENLGHYDRSVYLKLYFQYVLFFHIKPGSCYRISNPFILTIVLFFA